MQTALENLKLVLTSPRERAKGTIVSYLQTAKVFLEFLGDGRQPDDKDFRRYFVHRREKDISERTLTKEFIQLKKLADANNWPWPFTSDDRPVAEEEPFAPAFTPEEIETLIKAREEYSKGELFYVAVSTTWGLRREEMVRIRKRDYTEVSIKIKTAKHGRRVEHIIPDEINPILQNYRPKLNNINSLSYLFYRVLNKAGIERRKGYGWHSVRRTLRTILEWNLAENRLPLSLVADYMGWSRTQKGIVYGGAPMLGVYSHPEIMSADPFAIDRLVLGVHPFLKHWVVKD
ncbi:hypothetical protein ES703_00371 [subsurface metagenome]